MADKTLPPGGFSGAQSNDPSARRAFLRRAVGVGVPVVLATVGGRSVLAQVEFDNGSGCASMTPSGWRFRNYGPEDQYDPIANPHPCDGQQEGLIDAPAPQPNPVVDDPFADPPEDETKQGGGWGKGGKPK